MKCKLGPIHLPFWKKCVGIGNSIWFYKCSSCRKRTSVPSTYLDYRNGRRYPAAASWKAGKTDDPFAHAGPPLNLRSRIRSGRADI